MSQSLAESRDTDGYWPTPSTFVIDWYFGSSFIYFRPADLFAIGAVGGQAR